MTTKRVSDMLAALVLLVATAPIFAVVAIAQRAERMPVLWRSPRVGRGGRADKPCLINTDAAPVIAAARSATTTGP